MQVASPPLTTSVEPYRAQLS